MTTKKQTSTPDVSKTIGELKSLLVNDPNGLHRISFKSYGRKFVITNTDNDFRSKLEKSFNGFMKALNICTTSKKIKGLCFIDKQSNAFKMAYMKEGEQVLHQIVRKKV
jgi:hypothetical protein